VRKAALADLLPFQRSDFEGIFKAMDGLPVTVRLLDPPLHEFLPEGDMDEIAASIAELTGKSVDEALDRMEAMSEVSIAYIKPLIFSLFGFS
jgi:pyruvate,orthophosphate dikinase